VSAATGYLDRIGADLRAAPPRPVVGFAAALRGRADVGVIAEVKRASPSQGAIAPAADVVETARAYAAGGAAAVSVLCAERDFGGSRDHLARVRAAVGAPLLAKDFLLYPEQVAAHRLAGADCVLVIMALVSDDEARALLAAARALGMDTLAEAHDEADVERAVALGAELVGVNARDLNTLEVDVARQLALLDRVPDTAVRVAESGVAARTDVERARDAGADGVLVGTALMRRPALLHELVGVPR
jgi:indole-3-glycerol phosphate synthase